jgi:hypothetical protein
MLGRYSSLGECNPVPICQHTGIMLRDRSIGLMGLYIALYFLQEHPTTPRQKAHGNEFAFLVVWHDIGFPKTDRFRPGACILEESLGYLRITGLETVRSPIRNSSSFCS